MFQESEIAMCLETVSDKIDKPTTLIQSGWKTFTGTQTQLRFENMPFKGSRDVPLDKWITAEATVEKISTGAVIRGRDYKPGFHIYEDEQEVKSKTYKRRVYYRKVHTRGKQDGLTVIVALEMYVPSDPDAWPQN
jgi:hypothetical protein